MIMEKSIHNIIAYMVCNDIEYMDLSGNGYILFEVTFNLTDKQLRGIILNVMKNGFKIDFENNKAFITQTI